MRTRGDSSDADVRTFWRKNFGFFEIYGVSARTRGEGGLSQCGHFTDKGGQFCADVFYGRPLTRARMHRAHYYMHSTVLSTYGHKAFDWNFARGGTDDLLGPLQ